MAVGEAILGAFFSVLFERLASRPVVDYVRRFKGMHSKLEKWTRMLRMMEAVLIDAEEKQLTDKPVKIWLDDLKDLAYDVEDILDEFATYAAKRELKIKSRSRVQNQLPSFTDLKFRNDMAAKMDDITSRLDGLCQMKDKLRLADSAGVTASSTTSVSRRLPSTCLPPEYDVGRDDEKKQILESVLRDDSTSSSDFNFRVVSVVGLGGIGKTTLARSVYNNSKVEEEFNLKAWVCVSQDFDILRISKAILESLGTSCNSAELNQVQVKLREHLAGKKFLVVLDDVWSNEYANWEALRTPLSAGAPGSKIIVTTRSTNVASTMGSICCHELKPLSGDACWSIFKKHAGSCGDSEAIRDKVVKRCSGLPLAARTLGGLMLSKQRNEWEKMLDDKIWELSYNGSNILPVLRLSYQHLPAYLKRCFAYCAIFPEDYEFEEMEVVLLWMAERLIHESRSNKEMDDLGREYFQDLSSRSLFQRSTSDSSKFGMHDLVNALAQEISGETSFGKENDVTSSKIIEDFKKVRHASYSGRYLERKDRFEVFYKTQFLRTMLPIPGGRFISGMVVYDLLPKLKKLRVLSLKGYKVYELPDSVGGLIHLRALNLARTMIRSLPESTCSLLNLQTLILKDCEELRKLPSKLKDLVNLRYLNIRGANKISEMPDGVEELKSLRNLSDYIVGKGRGSNLKELKGLKFLSGELRISGLQNVEDLNEAILCGTNYLKVLILEWRHTSDSTSRDQEVERKVLDMLRPHMNLEELTVTGYLGNGFPSWIRDLSFLNMKVLRLIDWANCTALPSFRQLSCLKELFIQGIKGVQNIPSEIYGESLEILSIVDCPKLSENLPQNLTSLEELMIRNCEELVVSLSNTPKLRDITIDRCKRVVCNSPHNSKQVKSMNLSSISDSESSLIHGFQKVDYLNSSGCENLVSRWQYDIFLETQPIEKHSHTSLVELRINSCPSLISIPNFCLLSFLKKLEISQCNALTSLPNGVLDDNSHLESLTIESCDSLIFVAKGQLPASLKELCIKSCQKLQYLTFDGREDAGTLSCSSTSSLSHGERITNDSITVILDELNIFNCPSLICLFSNGLHPAIKDLSIYSCPNLAILFLEGQLPHLLQHLYIFNCSKLELVAERFHNHMCLEYLSINSCENLKSIPDGLEDLDSLRVINIGSCKGLVRFPQGGLPNNISTVKISSCGNLEAPSNFLHNLNTLTILDISGDALNIYKSLTVGKKV